MDWKSRHKSSYTSWLLEYLYFMYDSTVLSIFISFFCSCLCFVYCYLLQYNRNNVILYCIQFLVSEYLCSECDFDSASLFFIMVNQKKTISNFDSVETIISKIQFTICFTCVAKMVRPTQPEKCFVNWSWCRKFRLSCK